MPTSTKPTRRGSTNRIPPCSHEVDPWEEALKRILHTYLDAKDHKPIARLKAALKALACLSPADLERIDMAPDHREIDTGTLFFPPGYSRNIDGIRLRIEEVIRSLEREKARDRQVWFVAKLTHHWAQKNGFPDKPTATYSNTSSPFELWLWEVLPEVGIQLENLRKKGILALAYDQAHAAKRREIAKTVELARVLDPNAPGVHEFAVDTIQQADDLEGAESRREPGQRVGAKKNSKS